MNCIVQRASLRGSYVCHPHCKDVSSHVEVKLSVFQFVSIIPYLVTVYQQNKLTVSQSPFCFFFFWLRSNKLLPLVQVSTLHLNVEQFMSLHKF